MSADTRVWRARTGSSGSCVSNSPRSWDIVAAAETKMVLSKKTHFQENVVVDRPRDPAMLHRPGKADHVTTWSKSTIANQAVGSRNWVHEWALN